jgi:polyadenylate-binding protein
VKAAVLALCHTKRQIKVQWFPVFPEFIILKRSYPAAAAMHGMNGALLGSKQLVVRLHEPKQLRQEKLAARFAGHNGHPRSASGATSPTLSEGGESYVGWPSPGAKSVILGSPVAHSERLERPRRGSGSYYNVIIDLMRLRHILTLSNRQHLRGP